MSPGPVVVATPVVWYGWVVSELVTIHRVSDGRMVVSFRGMKLADSPTMEGAEEIAAKLAPLCEEFRDKVAAVLGK